jgi:hypothetical protein
VLELARPKVQKQPLFLSIPLLTVAIIGVCVCVCVCVCDSTLPVLPGEQQWCVILFFVLVLDNLFTYLNMCA